MTHTPGPWNPAMNGRIIGHFKPNNPDGGFWADICQVELRHSDGSGPGNFSLILSVPKLLDACRRALRLANYASHSNDSHLATMARLTVEQLADAIISAEGDGNAAHG